MSLHRLDRIVSGVMVYAISKKFTGKMSEILADKNLCEKAYLAVIHGTMEEKSGTLCDLLFKDTHLSKSFVVTSKRKGVKEASLSYEVLAEKEDLSLIKVTLHTGRTHQIRVQFSSRQHPLCGDKKYGAKDNFKNIGLFSHSISFLHPKTNEKMYFSSFPDFENTPFSVFNEHFEK